MNRMGQIAGGLVLLIIIGVLAGNPASAQPIKAPAKITSPGVYELSEDARGITDINGISIECSNVVLDGGNHFLGGEQREKSVGVYVNQYGGSITNVTVKNLILEKWETGIDYKYVKGQEGDENLITKCDIVESDTGIHVEYSDYIQVVENQISDCPTAINVEELSTYTQFKNNIIKNSGLGIGVTNCRYTTIQENNINTCSVYGVQVVDSEDTTITKNGIGDNKYAAISIESSKESKIIGNTLTKTQTGPVLIIGNEVRHASVTDNYFGSYESVSVDDVSSEIAWNSTQTPGTNILGGPYMGGNYWGSAPGEKGFSDTAPDEDGFGIADKPYQINEYNIDYLPLTHTTATKAPEEQISTPVANVSAQSSDNLTKEVIPESPSQPIPGNDTQSSYPVPTKSENSTGTPDSVNTPFNRSNESPVLSVQNQTIEQQSPVDIPDPSNSSIMNRSLTNAYPVDESPILPSVTSEAVQNQSGTDHMVPPDSSNGTLAEPIPGALQKPEPTPDISANESSPTPVGYILFNLSQPDCQVMLTTASGSNISLDPTQGNTITVPVPVEGLVYTSYRVEKDGFAPVTGNISPYPASGQTITIPVILNREQPNNTPVSKSNENIDTRATIPPTIPVHLPLVNISPMNATIPVSNTTGSNQSMKVNASPEIKPVPTENLPPVVISNGVITNTSTASSHIINASAGPGGSIVPSGDVRVPDGGTITFKIKPDEGHLVSHLVIDGIQTGPMSEYQFIDVTSDHTIATTYT